MLCSNTICRLGQRIEIGELYFWPSVRQHCPLSIVPPSSRSCAPLARRPNRRRAGVGVPAKRQTTAPRPPSPRSASQRARALDDRSRVPCRSRGGTDGRTDGRTAKFSRTWGKRTKCGHARTPCASERERCPKAGSASGEATCTSEQGRRGGKKFDCSDRKVSLPRPAVLEFFILIINGPAFRSALRYVVREGATTRSKYPTSAAAVLASLN